MCFFVTSEGWKSAMIKVNNMSKLVLNMGCWDVGVPAGLKTASLNTRSILKIRY